MQAPAKLNLSLDVLGRRPDGFHQLQTVMLSVRLYDSLQFSKSESDMISLRCDLRSLNGPPSSAMLSADDNNLVVRAAHLVKEVTGCQLGVNIALTKRIPMEAGMGGCSSDAAATLVALNQFWNLQLSSRQLHELAARLGSDVNFFLNSPTAAFCTGRGEEIQPVQVAGPLHFVVLKPDFGLSTAKVFQEWGASGQATAPRSSEIITALGQGKLDGIGNILSNDLQSPAARLNAQLQQILLRIAGEDVVGSGMTGSGSGCYALCRTAAHARHLAGKWKHWRCGQVLSVSSGV